MKLLYFISSFVLIVAFSSCSTSRYYQSDTGEYYQPESSISYQQFYNDLSPYGNWMNYGEYGYVWIPYQHGFRPYYTNGRWVYTNYGWTWASNYNWGWAPFHYGRWMYNMMYGWMWIPGYEWAPAWVSWRGGADYYGWAPLGPGMGVNNSYGSIPSNYWAFVPHRYITSNRLNNYYIDQSRNVTIINNTTIINNNSSGINRNNNNGRPHVIYNPGPPVREVERSTGNRIRQMNVVESGKPGNTEVNNNTLRVYRPVVNQNSTNSANTRPQRVVTPDQLRQNNSSNPNDVNNQPSAPVRQFPKEQTPEPNRNEPPLRNQDRIIQNNNDNNNNPSRVSPNHEPQQNTAPVRRNPDNENTPEQNKPPRRTFRQNSTPQTYRDPQPQPAPQVKEKNDQQNPQNNPAPAPVRRFSNPATTSANHSESKIRREASHVEKVDKNKSEREVSRSSTVRELRQEKKD